MVPENSVCSGTSHISGKSFSIFRTTLIHFHQLHPCILFIHAKVTDQKLGHFSSPEPKTHIELIGYPWSGVRPSIIAVRPSVRHRRPQCSNIFFSETACPIKAKFYVEPPWVRGTKVCSWHLGHMTKMT